MLLVLLFAICLAFFLDFHKVKHVNKNNNIIVVLGCANNFLQNDRISTVKNYVNSKLKPNNKIIWYLSGGIKNKFTSSVPEAELMKRQLKDMPGEFVLDTKATNTAENFLNFKNFVDSLDENYQINIVTSEFHKNRAEKLFYGFFSNETKPNWILGSASCMSCETDELIHMKNVQNDINKAYGYIILN